MRSYTNRKGELIEVSKEHLDTAVRIKKELQKNSPSRKCSWSLLVSLMRIEGFDNAENSETYRCLIKAYQKSIGELPEAPKYAEMVADSKLQSIKDLVGEMAYEKRENQQYLKEINKGKRELIDFAIIAEQIGDAFKNHDFSTLNFNYQPIIHTYRKKMIINLADLHIGAIVDNVKNVYNYFVAQERMQTYLNRVLDECKKNHITDVFVMNLGDAIEHSSMRYAQGYGIEFPFSIQIVKATDIITKFLIGLSEHVHVHYAGIAGNHDRIDGEKDKNIDGDHAVRIINQSIKNFIENAKVQRITYEQADDYGYSLKVNNRMFKFLHGDLDNHRNENLVAKHSDLDDTNYDAIVMGHYHHHRVLEVGEDKFIILIGSLKGADDYTVNKLRTVSSPSQGIIMVDEDGDIEVKRIKVS